MRDSDLALLEGKMLYVVCQRPGEMSVVITGCHVTVRPGADISAVAKARHLHRTVTSEQMIDGITKSRSSCNIQSRGPCGNDPPFPKLEPCMGMLALVRSLGPLVTPSRRLLRAIDGMCDGGFSSGPMQERAVKNPTRCRKQLGWLVECLPQDILLARTRSLSCLCISCGRCWSRALAASR
jgi:hypothetical protein